MRGNYLPMDTPPPPHRPHVNPNDWMPYKNQLQFEMAEFLFTRNQMSAGDINILLDLWARSLAEYGDKPPFASYNELYRAIDSTPLGEVTWESFSVQYNGEKPDRNAPEWMSTEFDVWFRDPLALVHNLLSNPDFNKEFDFAPLQEYDYDGNHRFQDFMSGDWAWKQAVSHSYHISLPVLLSFIQDIIAEDPETHGSMFVPIILGSDKTTVSVATGNNEYYPIYLSIGNLHNNVRRAHRNGVVLLGFLAIPKSRPSAKLRPSVLIFLWKPTRCMLMMQNSGNFVVKFSTHRWLGYSNL